MVSGRRSKAKMNLPPLRQLASGRVNEMILQGQTYLERIAWLEKMVRRFKDLYAACHSEMDQLPYNTKMAVHALGRLSDKQYTNWPTRHYTAEFKRYVCDSAYWYWKHNRASKAAVARSFGVPWSDYLEWEDKYIHGEDLEETQMSRDRAAMQQQQKLKKPYQHTPRAEVQQELQALAHAVNDVKHIPKFVPPVPELDEAEHAEQLKQQKMREAKTIAMPEDATAFDIPKELL